MSYAIPREFVENYVSALNGISDWNRRLLTSELEKYSWHTMDRAKVLDDVVKLTQTVTTASSKQAAVLAAQFYKGLRIRELGEDTYDPIEDDAHDPDETEQAVRALATEYARTGNAGAFTAKLSQRVGYETKRAAGRTMYANGRADPRRVRFARVPQRTKTYANGCAWCQTLASRGFWYLSEVSAGKFNPDHYHSGCNCAVVASWGADSVEGYDPDEYLSGYDAFKEGRHAETTQEEAQRSHHANPYAAAKMR